MPYITKKDDISALPLSFGVQNCLRQAGIYTVGTMMECPVEKLIHIHSIGKKRAEKLQALIQALQEGHGEFVLLEAGRHPIADSAALPQNTEVAAVVFVDETGAVIRDMPIQALSLSDRAKKSLSCGGYEFASQLVGITGDELMKLPRMGRKTAKQVLACAASISVYKEGTIAPETSRFGNNLAEEMSVAYDKEKYGFLGEILAVQAQFPEAMGETRLYRLYDRVFVRSAVKEKILRIVEQNGGEISRSTLEERLPQHLNNTTILAEILLELESDAAIEMGNVMIYRRYTSVVQYAAQLSDPRVRAMLQARLDGKTLQEVADQHKVSHERVRQLTQQELKKRPPLREDQYLYIYNHYDFTRDDFGLAFDEPPQTYYYLAMVCQTVRSQRKPLEEILTDTAVPPAYRKQAERAIGKRYVFTDGVQVKRTRPDLVKHYIKSHCKNLTKFKSFVAAYNFWLEGLGLEDNSSFMLEARTYENVLNRCDYVLWNQGHSFRYYNIPEHDFEEMFATLRLEAYEDTEFSTFRLFRDYPDLMQQYDIRDEYELHNLLKKIWPAENKNVKFKKMPTIAVGNADADKQVISLLFQYAPISVDDLASLYEEKYGVKASSAKANHFGVIANYCYNGMCSVDYAALPAAQFDRMKSLLNRDFYTIQYVKRLYQREFPNAAESLLNPCTLKTLGFHVYPGYSGYIVKKTFSGATDYFRWVLTHDDMVDMNCYDSAIRNLATYNSELNRLRSIYEIVEFSPLQYIHIRRLQAAGVTQETLKAYCHAVAMRYEKGEYFTVTSLYGDGFAHEIDDLGFDAWFYSSVLLEDRKQFSYQRVGGTRIFLRGKPDANLGDMLQWLMEKYQKIDFYDLMDLLKNQYGIVISKEKLRGVIDGTDLYYDSIMEAVYIDYDTYFEEI